MGANKWTHKRYFFISIPWENPKKHPQSSEQNLSLQVGSTTLKKKKISRQLKVCGRKVHIFHRSLCCCFHLSIFFSRGISIFPDAGNSHRPLVGRTAQQCCSGCQPRIVVFCSHHANPYVTVLSPLQNIENICLHMTLTAIMWHLQLCPRYQLLYCWAARRISFFPSIMQILPPLLFSHSFRWMIIVWIHG